MATAITNDDKAIREDLLGVITNIDPTETQLYTGLAKSEARGVNHEWPVDTLKTVGTNARVEGADPSFEDRTDPTRLNNICQIIAVSFQVSNTERAVNTAGFADRYSYEMDKAMTEWKNDAEYALMRSVVGSTSGSALRSMKGLKESISTNATNQSGVSMSETHLNDYLQTTWGNGGNPDEIYVGGQLKRRISGFTSGSTKFTEVTDRRLVNAVDVYDSDFGRLKIFKHRWITQSGDTNLDIVGIQSDKFRIAHLRNPQHQSIANTGDATKGQIVGELTLEFLAQKSSFKAVGVL